MCDYYAKRYLQYRQDLEANKKKIAQGGTKVYIAGPMSGVKEFNIPLFNKVEKDLVNEGYEVVNPVNISKKYVLSDILNEGKEFGKMLKEQQDEEKRCSILYLLPGWENSIGARMELMVALSNGLEIRQI